ncbi:uncharacterized protein TNCV_1726471 [Trichonephila clavipes]|nr:uncharacterized protein TNCV_1726471 [Trichonephila clavipes]
MRPCIGIHKNEVWANGTSEQMHMGKKYLITIAIPGYRPSVENLELSSTVQHNTSPDRNSKTTVTVSFLGVTGKKPGPDLSPNQNVLKITSGTEPTLIHKEDTTPLVDTSVIPCSCRPRVATTNLSNSCTCGLERLSSARNRTFIDSQLCSYTGDSTPLLQLSDHSSTCEVIQFGLAIHQNDHQARRRFVEWAQNEIPVVPDFHKRILFSDEAHFWLNGYVNKQNCRIWSEANPQVYVETPLHSEKLTVWCALWAGGILLQK